MKDFVKKRKTKVMVVEDGAVMARHLLYILEGAGYFTVSMVPSGEQAIQKAEDERPDIVLMDIVLQGEMDGIETADILYSKFDIPVIFITAYGEDEIFERAKKARPFGYVIKPVKKDELQKTIEMGLYRYRTDKENEEIIRGLEEEVYLHKRMEKRISKVLDTCKTHPR